MSGERAPAAPRPPKLRLGRLVPAVRHRAVGSETSVTVEGADGVLQISVETEMAFDEIVLRQSVMATFDETLRPERCYVDAAINSRRMQIEIVVGRHDALVRVASERGEEERLVPVHGRPLLMIDNCFTLHALAAWWTVHGDRSEQVDPAAGRFTALPIGRDLRTTHPALERILFGGDDLGTPSLTLHLGPGLDEHVWFVDNRVERLAIPRLHVRVDRPAGPALDGD